MKPILYNTEMVRAILEDRKTVTRRVMKPQPKDCDDCHHDMQTCDQMLPQFYKGDYSCVCRKCGYGTQPNGESIFNPPYRPGDILYVREMWYYETFYENTDNAPDLTSGRRSWRYVYKADNPDYPVVPGHWHPSIHMPREAARIFLRVTDVRVERLQDITEDGSMAEGIQCRKPSWARIEFADLWNSTIKPDDILRYSWEANPWVWVIEFERCGKPGGD